MPFPDEEVPVVIVDFDPGWAAEFAMLSSRLQDAFAEIPVAVDHVGSTAVPHLPAKDVIDVQVRVRVLDAAAVTEALSKTGFRRRPEPWNQSEVAFGTRCRKLTFAPPLGERRANVAIREHDAVTARAALLFRDFLRAHAEVRDSWGEFKLRLAAVAPDLAEYGATKAPATSILFHAADGWAKAKGWMMPPPP